MQAAQQILAREKWESLQIQSLVTADPKNPDVMEMKIALAEQAYGDDPQSLAIAIEAITRRD
jgi:hypothetical protein